MNLIDSVDTILYGRATYQMMAEYLPHASGSFADRTNRLPKLVFSSTLAETPWGRLGQCQAGQRSAGRRHREAEEPDRQGHRDLRQRQPCASGSRSGAIDEYRLVVNPVVLGAGRPLFDGLAERISLRLIESVSWPSGCVALTYQPAG